MMGICLILTDKVTSTVGTPMVLVCVEANLVEVSIFLLGVVASTGLVFDSAYGVVSFVVVRYSSVFWWYIKDLS